MVEDAHGVLGVCFNACADCFALAMQSGIRIYNVEPLVKLVQIDMTMIGSVYLVELLNRTNLVGFVSGGRKPKYSENTVAIYDLAAKSIILEYSVPLPVVAFRLCPSFVVILTAPTFYVFSLEETPKMLFQCASGDNPNRVCDATSLRGVPQLAVFPASRIGGVHVVDLDECAASCQSHTSFTPPLISAHQSAISAVALNWDGRFLVTASVRGTLFRLWSLTNRQRRLLVEFRRGTEQATILSLSFAYPLNHHQQTIMLVAASDTGTAHVFVYADPTSDDSSSGGGSPRGPQQRRSVLNWTSSSSATSGIGGAGSAVAATMSRIPQLLDACNFFVGVASAKATRLLPSHTHAVAVSKDGRIQRFAILAADRVVRRDTVDTFFDPLEDV